MVKKKITEVGKLTPQNLKFGIVVAIAIFWAEFIRTLLKSLVMRSMNIGAIYVDFFMAVLITALGYLFIKSYRKFINKLGRIHVDHNGKFSIKKKREK